MNLARLNHILIPATKAERDRFRSSRTAAVFQWVFGWWIALSLEGRFLFVFWLLAGAASANVDITSFYIFWALLSGLLAAALVVRRGFALTDVRLQVHAPPRTTVGETATFVVELINQGDREHQSVRVDGPFLPWDGTFTSPPPRLDHLPAGTTRRLAVTARFEARGEHHLDPFSAQALAPLGLSEGPGIESAGTRFLVVPRPANIIRVLTPTNQRYQPGGVALASRTGESRELIGVRPYQPGDPIRDLHAPTWARIGEPVVRQYQQEYFTRIGVVVDTEQGRAPEARFEAALSAAAGIVACLSRGEALIDLLVAGERMIELTLGRSLGFLEQALELLATVQPGPALEPQGLEARLTPYLPRLSCVVLVVLDWDAPRQQLADWIRARGVGCRVILVADEIPPRHTDSNDLTVLTTAQVADSRELVL